jgi:hypothetical protein
MSIWTKNTTRENLIQFYNELNLALHELYEDKGKTPPTKDIKKVSKPILDKWQKIFDKIEIQHKGIVNYIFSKEI